MKILRLAMVSVLMASGCNDDMPSQPPAPLDVSGTWQGTVSPSQNIQSACGGGSPVAVSATFTQTGSEVLGSFEGGCLNRATFQGFVNQQRMVGQTQLAGSLDCPDAGRTLGPGSQTQLSLSITVVRNPISGTCSGPFGTTQGTLNVELTR